MVESRDIKISIKKGKPGKECRKIAQGSQRTGYETTEGASRWLSDQNDNNDKNNMIIMTTYITRKSSAGRRTQ